MIVRPAWLLGSSLLFVACGGSVSSSGTPDSATPDSGTTDTLVAVVDTAVAIDTAIPSEQKLLFEASYVNYAWGFTYSGIYVNAAGEVWSYQSKDGAPRDPSLEVSVKASMTEAEITAKYASSAKLLTTVPKDVLLAKLASAREAERGALTESGNCADYGVITYVAWRYDPGSGQYAPTRLGADGDAASRNSSPSAEVVVEWLASLTGRERTCKLETINCTGSGCRLSECKPGSGQVSACDGTCVVAGRCDKVSSCSVCQKPYQVCVVDDVGDAHCTYGASDMPVTCATEGDRLCAGGASWCSGSADAGFLCHKFVH